MGVGGIGIWQLIIVLVIIMLIFGTKKLKNLGSDLGGAIKGFKNAMGDDAKGNKSPEQLEGDGGSTIDVKAEKVEDQK
ncbi:MAG: Sec-independent protein translocase subunit TatA [Pseudohongiellaceae bacterium]|jgi:sec-independent protein translocase protein TatA